MSEDIFNIYAAIGIGLTFIASLTAIVVSIISLKSAKRIAKQSGYLNTITASREKWQNTLRENSSLYFTQITRICDGQEKNLTEIYNELTRYYFAIILLLFKQNEELQNNMSAIQEKAFQIVDENNMINKQSEKTSKTDHINIEMARQQIDDLTLSISEHQKLVLDEIRKLIESEWRKQQYEATTMWEWKKKRSGICFWK